jgi:putative SOS response-associated peptidase YedK
MCGRFALDHTTNQLIEEFVVSENRFPDWAPHWNIAPTSMIPILSKQKPGVLSVECARWSLVPPWATELKLPYPTFNARSESAGEKPTFRTALKNTRCIIPASGFYEWKTVKGQKTPHFIQDPLAPLLLFAGLASWWSGPEHPDPIATATILTMDSAGPLSSIHSRMPVLVAKDFFHDWLDPEDPHGQELLHETCARTLHLVETLQVDTVTSPSAEAVAKLNSGSH